MWIESLREAAPPDHENVGLDPFFTAVLSDPDLVLGVFISQKVITL